MCQIINSSDQAKELKKKGFYDPKKQNIIRCLVRGRHKYVRDDRRGTSPATYYVFILYTKVGKGGEKDRNGEYYTADGRSTKKLPGPAKYFDLFFQGFYCQVNKKIKYSKIS